MTMTKKAEFSSVVPEAPGKSQSPGDHRFQPVILHQPDAPRQKPLGTLSARDLAPLFHNGTAEADPGSGKIGASFTLLQGGYTTMNSMVQSQHLVERLAWDSGVMDVALPHGTSAGLSSAAFGWNLLNSLGTSPKPKGSTSGEALAYVGSLATEALLHRAVKHPYLEALDSGDLPDTRWALADFARHYTGYSQHFPRYLTTVISRLAEARHRDDLLENLTEESGIYEDSELAELADNGIEKEWIVGRSHPRLFDRFRRAMGVENSEHIVEPDQVICWREMFLSILANGSPAEAVGALGLGTEQIVSTIYQPFTRAIERLGDLSPRDSVFFPLHTTVDEHHQKTLQKVAADLVTDDRNAQELRRGMLKALNLRSVFWDWMYSRALNPTHADHMLS